MSKLFNETFNIFQWPDVQTFLIRSQYNEMLKFVLDQYTIQYPAPQNPPENNNHLPNFLNEHYCLTIKPCKPEKPPVGVKSKAEMTAPSPNTTEGHGPASDNCREEEPRNWFLRPDFFYERQTFLTNDSYNSTLDLDDFVFNTHSLTVGAVIWLYYYERMGIFKILGALLDDYNYKGKYTISGRRPTAASPTDYSILIDMISTLHRLGISSNLRDRICLYQRVLGVGIENKLGIESERNTGFMQTFNRLIDYQLEYYKSKQLAQAIQAQQSVNVQPRSSVATQTSIRDTIDVLRQHLEPLQYGRNQINTFLGIATVHATLCLVNMLKAEIGIPAQYDNPKEFIPAAYDILVAAKGARTLNETNRFIVYDNCASYGYRLLTDIETIILTKLNTIATGSTLDLWLNDVEGLVEGYRNAYSAVPEKVEAIV